MLPNEFAQKIVGRANFCNILVYACLHINREIVCDNLQEIDDFRTLQKHVLTYLSTVKGASTP